MNPSEYILNLASKTLENSSLRVSDFVRQAVRIARLRDDYINLWWLEWELVNITNEEQRLRILHEIMPHFTTEQYKTLQQ